MLYKSIFLFFSFYFLDEILRFVCLNLLMLPKSERCEFESPRLDSFLASDVQWKSHGFFSSLLSLRESTFEQRNMLLLLPSSTLEADLLWELATMLKSETRK